MNFFNAFAFGVGMVALVNPCGFGLLPAYLGVFLGQEDDSPNRWISLSRAQVVGLAMTLGMLVVFGFFGLVLGGLQSAVAQVLPYFNIALGIGLIVLAVAMFRGFQLTLKIPKMQRGGESGSFASMFLFGMSYATASLTCTLGLFITAVNASNFTGGGDDGGSNFFSSFGALVSYGLGMGLLATMITLALALGKSGLVGRFRSILPMINKISAVLLIIVGPFSILYGIWELQILGEWPLGENVLWGWLNDFMGSVLSLQADVANWFSSDVDLFGRMTSRTSLLGWPFLIINLAVIVGGVIARRQRKAGDADALDAAADELVDRVEAATGAASDVLETTTSAS